MSGQDKTLEGVDEDVKMAWSQPYMDISRPRRVVFAKSSTKFETYSEQIILIMSMK